MIVENVFRLFVKWRGHKQSLIVFIIAVNLIGQNCPCFVDWGCRIYWLHFCREVRLLPMEPSVGFWWWPVILEDRILVAEQFMALVLSSHMTCNSPFFSSYGARQAVREAQSNWLVILSPSTYMIVSNCLQIILVTSRYLTLVYLKDL